MNILVVCRECGAGFSGVVLLQHQLSTFIMPRGGATAYGSSFVCLFVIMPRAELRRHTVIVLSVSQSVFYKYFSSLTEN